MTDGHVDWASYEAVLFDLDGVVTPTAQVHEHAWAELFADGFDYTDLDYLELIDGKPRLEGVRSFLASRGIALDEGTPEDSSNDQTIWGFGNKKNAIFNRMIEQSGITAYEGSVRLLDHLDRLDLPYGIVSSSRNAVKVLAASGLSSRFEFVVDGNTTAEKGLRGKPAPDSYLLGAQLLETDPSRTIVIEDAVSGVQAGAAGGFGLVVGVDRGAGRDSLIRGGANHVVADLAETLFSRRLSPAPNGMDQDRFFEDAWRLVEVAFDPSDLGLTETLFGLGNGFVGMRADTPEDGTKHCQGTFVNGLYESWPISYPEDAFGFARNGQSIVNVPDAKGITVTVDGEQFLVPKVDVEQYQRTLDFRTGVLTREVTWRTAQGKEVHVRTQRMVSFVDRHLVVMSVEIEVDSSAEVSITSRLANVENGSEATQSDSDVEGLSADPRTATFVPGRVLVPTAQAAHADEVTLAFRTQQSELPMACGVHHHFNAAHRSDVTTVVTPDLAETVAHVTVEAGQSMQLTKLVAYHADADASSDELAQRCSKTLQTAVELGVDELAAQQQKWLDGFWLRSDIEITGAAADQQALRWNLFQLAQASGCIENQSIPAKGVSAGGYDGHYFWDTEVFAVPFLSYTTPHLAKEVLRYRWNTLDNARRRANEMAQKGALFAWRTIGGDECSAYYPAGTAQYHINAAVAFALERYTQATRDQEFMVSHGAELLIETARLWVDLGFFGSDGRFHIHRVTGPDEYSAVVNDNTYTNVMAQANLRFAVRALNALAVSHPAQMDELRTATRLSVREIATWSCAADSMYIALDEHRQIHAQDACFLELEQWPWDTVPDDKYPLLLNFHPLVIYRHQVLKQPDVVLATLLQPDQFTEEQRRNNFDYYDAITTGDSSLSAGSQAAAAARSGRKSVAWHHFRQALYLDLCNTHGNTGHGVHVASAGGVWNAILAGFIGFVDTGDAIRLDPQMPEELGEVTMSLAVRGVSLRLRAERSKCAVEVVSDGYVDVITTDGTTTRVTADAQLLVNA